MAIDSRNKRFSVMGLALPLGFPLANPDGSIVAADQQQALMCYSGIAFNVVTFSGWTEIATADSEIWTKIATADSETWTEVSTADSEIWTEVST